MTKIKFSAQLHNSGKRIKAISGRLGLFIFRTYPDGKITAYYKQPKNTERPPVEAGGVASAEEGITCRYRADYESLSKQLREIADHFGLTIKHINYDF